MSSELSSSMPQSSELELGDSAMDVDPIKEEETAPPTEEKPKRKKRRRLCEECGEKEAAERKKQRKFAWTEKNRPAFEKCQTTRKLKQAVEQAKKLLGSILLEETLEGSNEDLAHRKELATSVLHSSTAAYEEFVQKLQKNKKSTNEKSSEETTVESTQ